MTATAIWIDQHLAKIFKLPEALVGAVHSHRRDHHTHHIDNREGELQRQSFYRQVADRLPSDGQIVILGPGMARFHFQNYLKEQHPMLNQRVVACEAVDHLTDPQIAARAQRLIAFPSAG